MIFSSGPCALFILVTLNVLLLHLVEADKILVISFIVFKSHKLTYYPLLVELGKRGHEITVLTPLISSEKYKNVKEIKTLDWAPKLDPFENKKKNKTPFLFLHPEAFEPLCRKNYDLPAIKQITEEKFDLIFIQPFFNECALGLVYRLGAPVVIFMPVSAPGFVVEKVGGYLPPSFNPNVFADYPHEMNFFERFQNFGLGVAIDAIMRFYYEPVMTAVYREKLGQDIPPAHEIVENASLILSNGHFTLVKSKSFPPDVVDIGGIHSFVPSNPLPKDIEDFINKGKDGFIFFSMGTAVQLSTMPEEYRQMFLKVFSKLKQQVIWKWETETMQDLPANVKLMKWLPQQDLLAHKDIKLFITHCGGGSTEEAIYNGVPLIAFPMFGDQKFNSRLASENGLAIKFDWNELTEEKLSNALNEVLNTPKYRENAKKLSVLFRDRPESPMKTAVYWIEYVLRHKGAPHLRSVGRKLNWFQYHSYDVIITYIGLFLVSLYLLFCIGKWTVCKVCGIFRSPSSPNKKRSKKD